MIDLKFTPFQFNTYPVFGCMCARIVSVVELSLNTSASFIKVINYLKLSAGFFR